MLYIQYFRYALYAVFLVHKVLGCSSALSLTGRCNRLAPPLYVMLSIEHLVVPNSPVSLWTFYLTCFLSLSLANCSIFPMGLNNMSWSVSLILKQSKVLRNTVSDWLETGVFWCGFFFFFFKKLHQQRENFNREGVNENDYAGSCERFTKAVSFRYFSMLSVVTFELRRHWPHRETEGQPTCL